MFALVLGLLAFLYMVSASLVLCAEVNVVRVDRLYPRALLGPFTDDVELTSADPQTYTRKAGAERLKGFSARGAVTFDSTRGTPSARLNRNHVTPVRFRCCGVSDHPKLLLNCRCLLFVSLSTRCFTRRVIRPTQTRQDTAPSATGRVGGALPPSGVTRGRRGAPTGYSATAP